MNAAVLRLSAFALALLPVVLGCQAPGAPGRDPTLALERSIPLPDGAGRIDHLAIDVAGRRLFVAELGNGSVDAVDLRTGAVTGRVPGLAEPQGLAFLPQSHELAVACGGDGELRFFHAADLSPAGSIPLGPDADDLRVDDAGRVAVGYGAGALALVDPKTRKVVSTVALSAHPEGFQLDGSRAYVNLPDAAQIATADLSTGRVNRPWGNAGLNFNFPLALDRGLIAVAYRLPSRLALFDASGVRRQVLKTCGDADDLYFDGARRRLYVVCGSGAVDVFQRSGDAYGLHDRVATRAGARTGLYSPELDRLFVAARADPGRGAAILVFRPVAGG